MKWHYNLMKNHYGSFEIIEVYLNDEGNVKYWSETDTISNTKTEVLRTLQHMIDDIKKYKVVRIQDLPGGTGNE